ncbi:hypothetical protein [Paenibacillus xylanexedens]|uniref:hypothetical protein n=1 Tax=Paenibacillus xylanexedens TaxID=528191 RepID=UPI0011A1A954|nr:hypothetical protein [Paenibacillus xylanexedens]
MSKSQGQIRSRLQEQRITRSLKEIGEDARRQMASGALWMAKSDVVSPLFQIECKTKEKPGKSMSVKKEWLDKIEDEAFEVGKTAALAISFGTQTDYFILRDRDFLAFVEELTELRKQVNGDV